MKTRSAIAATLFACLPAIAGERQSVAEFTPKEFEKLDWRIVDDGVMGGLSQGKREISRDARARIIMHNTPIFDPAHSLPSEF